MQWKAAVQLHIRTGSGASSSRNEGFRELEADLSALFVDLLSSLLVWESNKNTNYHKSKPDENQVAPTYCGNCVSKNSRGNGCCHVAYKIQEAGCTGYHAGIAKAWAVAAPHDGGCTSGRENSQDQEYNIVDWLMANVNQHKADGSNCKRNQDGKLHIVVQFFVHENSNKWCQ